MNGRDPTGLLCDKRSGESILSVGYWKRCHEDVFGAEVDAAKQIVKHPLKTAGRAVAGVVGTGKMIGKAAVGVGAMVVDQQLAQSGDVNAMMRQGQRAMAMANAVRHPIDTVVDAHTRAADSILSAEESGHWFRASVEAGEVGSADAAAVMGAAEAGAGLARLTGRLSTAIVGEGEGLSVASGIGADSAPMSVVRTIQRGERVANLIDEVKSLTYETGNEHAIVKLANGDRAIVSGGPKGIDFAPNQIQRLYGHSHPYEYAPTGPSGADVSALQSLGQMSSYLLEHGELVKFFTP